MGVCNLWNVLEPVKISVSLSDLSGGIVAVDLAGWIVPSCKAGQKSSVSETYIMMRVLLYRIVNLLKLGIKPVFVLDGSAPDIKSQTLDKRQQQQGNSRSRSTERLTFQICFDKCVELLKALGLPYVSYNGEAEKMCAILNNYQKVDACITDDSDCFLYGAKIIYRNYDQSKKDTLLDKYTLDDIVDKLMLTRRDMISYALLAGCDYNETGVQGMGQKKTYTFIQELKKTYPDVLERILSWREDEKIKGFKQIQKKMSKTVKGRHCKTCCHSGSVNIHVNKGCDVCMTTSSCNKTNSILCTCSWHQLDKQVAPHLKEMEICDKALRDEKFPDMRIVSEFLNEDGSDVHINSNNFNWHVPDLKKLSHVIDKYLKLSSSKLEKVMLPAIVNMALHGTLPLSTVTPVDIKRSCQNNCIACYEVEWKFKESDMMIKEHSIIKVDKTLFQLKYPQLVQDFERGQESKKSSPNKGKRKIEHENQTTIKQFFSSKKKSSFEESPSNKKLKH